MTKTKTETAATPGAIYVVKGEDPVLRDAEASRLIDTLLAGEDRMYALEDFTIENRRRATADDVEPDVNDAAPSGEGSVMRSILTALQSPPFMTARRVVCIRDIAALAAEAAGLIAEYVADPLERVYVVFVHAGGRVPAALDKALKSSGATIVGPGSEKTADVLTQRLADADLHMSADARATAAARLGDDAGRVPEFVALLESTYGRGAGLEIGDIEQYLGEQGTVAPYLLTNAIDAGDVPTALDVLHRLLSATSARNPKPQHPLQVMGMLTRHYESLARLDSDSITSKQQAADILGMKEYPAGLRLQVARRLGSRGIADAIGHLADADLDLRGGIGGRRAVPAETVIEVLVARLASLGKRSGSSGPSSRRPKASARR